MPTPDFILRAGDTAASIASTLEDENGDPVSIQNATVRFHLGSITGTTVVVNADANNDQNGAGTDGTKGNVSYDWGAADTATAGWYVGEWQVTYADNSVQTFPNGDYLYVLINEQIA